MNLLLYQQQHLIEQNLILYSLHALITLGGKETCLLDDVRLIESEALALPTASTFKRSITKLVNYKYSDSWKKLCSSSWQYDQKPSLEENRGKTADFFGETRFEVKVKSPNPARLSGTSQ